MRYRSGCRKIIYVGERKETTMRARVRRGVARVMARATEAMVEALSTVESAAEIMLGVA